MSTIEHAEPKIAEQFLGHTEKFTIEHAEQFLADLAIERHGVILTADNLTAEGLTYLVDMGLKQSLGDVGNVNRPQILGVTAKGGIPEGNWTDIKRYREAIRLGFTGWTNDKEGRESLADVWIRDAVEAKFAKILSGELTVSESGVRGDNVTARMKELVAANIVASAAAKKLPIPKGKDLTAIVREKLAKPKIAEYFRATAIAAIAAEKAAIGGPVNLDELE